MGLLVVVTSLAMRTSDGLDAHILHHNEAIRRLTKELPAEIFAPLAQLVEVSHLDCEGSRFESEEGHQI